MSRRPVRALAVAGLIAIAACSDSTAPDDVISDATVSEDVAASVGTVAAMDVAWMRGDMTVAGLGGATSASLVAAGGAGAQAIGDHCDYQVEPKLWLCMAERENGIDVERTIQFFTGNQPTMAYDAAATDSIKVHASVSGTIQRPSGTITIANTRDAVISGLAGTETSRTVTGTGVHNETSAFSGDRGTRTYTGTVANQILSVVFPVGGGYPLSGSLVHDVNATVTRSGASSVTRTVSRHAVVTFNGTATVPLTVGTLSCTLQLDTRAITCAR